MVHSINKYLLLITIILIIFIIIVVFFYLKEKNIFVQKYLENIQERLNKNNIFDKIINTNCNVVYENNVIIINDFLTKEYFNFLRNQFNNKTFETHDFIVRKASGINFQQLHDSEEYKGLLEIYYSNRVLDFLSRIIKKPVQRISLGDQNACSLLVYSKKGDHINWHYDYSNYYGDRYVVLMTIVNENAQKDGGLSNNIFQYNYEGKIYDLKMKENSIIIFKGSEILHKSTEIGDNERRILLSMVYCDICQEKKNVFNIIYETTKNYIVYGN